MRLTRLSEHKENIFLAFSLPLSTIQILNKKKRLPLLRTKNPFWLMQCSHQGEIRHPQSFQGVIRLVAFVGPEGNTNWHALKPYTH